MKRAAIFLALGLAALAAHAGDEQWLLIATGENMEYHGQRGSALITENTVSFVMRTRRLDGTGQLDISRAIVNRAECARQSGTLLTTDLAFKVTRIRVDFAFGAGTVASIIAERVCNELRAPQAAPSSRREGVQL